MPDHDDIDFAMFDLPTRPGPARATTTPEQDPVEKRLAREIEAAPYLLEAAKSIVVKRMEGSTVVTYAETQRGIDIKCGSGKVKV